ncbi:MAG: OPT family oligopeptide transporter [Immundisolibacter sp.]|uniref:OPT family oligopeptide transporter n=1 Tax=Immundisolibacter sp. TaxID=1934948 RepID=UPI003EE3E3DF
MSPDYPRELTRRSVLTGMVIGALLTPCNVYSGLKIGWSFNMSIAAALLSYAFWRMAEDLFGAPRWGLLENNINQTTASASASIISSGLVAPIPALALLTGRQPGWNTLWLWVLAVSTLGVVVAIVMRRPMIERQGLMFPAGVATAETVREIYGRSAEALARVRMLFGAAGLAGGLKLIGDFWLSWSRWSPPLALPARGALGTGGISAGNLGLSLDPSLLMIGFGAIIGTRAGISLLLGACVAWVGLGPWALAQGWAQAGAADSAWFGPLVEWLIWPGVTLMTAASLTSFALTVIRLRRKGPRATAHLATPALPIPVRAFVLGAVAAVSLVVWLQHALFDIGWGAALAAVVLSLALAVVASRVVGETGIPPIGAIGKVAQLGLGALAPGNVTTNLMGANVTGGAAGQCADLLNDLRTGALLGATPAYQIIAQCFGVLAGSLVGSAVYLILIPDPVAQLLTPEWPAPAVATWKAVAEVLAQGLHALPTGSVPAMALAAVTGITLATGEALLPRRMARWLPSGAALGLAFVIPAWIAISLFMGAMAAACLRLLAPNWAARFVLAIAAGLVAGESLAGIAGALASLLGA